MTVSIKTVNKYLSDNDKPINTGYLLKDSGDGNFIARWSVDGLDQPTVLQLRDIAEDLESQEWLDAKNTHITKVADAKLYGGIIYNEMFISTAPISLTLLSGAATRALYEDDPDKQHKYHPPSQPSQLLTNAQFLEIGANIAVHSQKVLDAKEHLQENVATYDSLEEIETAFDAKYSGE